jgi:DNA-binding transcriptional regulator YhcF (GntR family)
MEQKTAFLTVFGDTPILRVLDFLIINDDFDHSMTDIAEQAGIGYATLKLFWPRLEAEGIVKNIRIVGKAKMYTLNEAHDAVKKLKALYWSVAKHAVHEKMKEPIVV